ncbi:MAG: 4-(cytidine 5'-diphospho)-2-C-methyl-D-erythritol kinase [Culicoidibacterales bacterium]
MKECNKRAYAKVNLTLEILGKRADGYHELRSIFMPLQFCDFVTVRLTKGTQNIRLISKYPKLNTKQNLMYQAADLFLKQYQLMYDVEIEYTKRIPSQAGLGGGSADAAAVIRALIEMSELTLSDSEIISLCSKIGADVPFCYFNQPALVSGIGDGFEFFENSYNPYVVLIKPKKGASTKRIFQQVSSYTDASYQYSDKMRKALMENDRIAVKDAMMNALELPAGILVPDILKIKADLVNRGFLSTIMSGSGSTVVCLVDDKQKANQIVDDYKRRGYFAVCTNFLEEDI